MGKSLRVIGALMVFGGAIGTSADLLADIVRGVQQYFSDAQLLVALAGQVVIILGGALLLVSKDVQKDDDWDAHGPGT